MPLVKQTNVVVPQSSVTDTKATEGVSPVRPAGAKATAPISTRDRDIIKQAIIKSVLESPLFAMHVSALTTDAEIDGFIAKRAEGALALFDRLV